MDRRRALIVGGGIAGLSLAPMLTRIGVAVEAIERESAWRPAGTGIYLPGNAARAFRALGLEAQVASRAVEIARQRFCDHRGRLVCEAESASEEVADRLAGLLPADALQDALAGLRAEEITGPGGLVTQLAGRVLETALGAELTEHLGYPPGQAPPGGAGNTRNGSTPKRVHTELGTVEIKTPRDRKGSFEPQLVGKRQTRLAGLDERVLGLYAGGMSVRDIARHLTELYGTEIGRDTISRVTDAVLEDIAAWRTRPLAALYPIVYFDCLMVRVREDRSVSSRACYLALGVTLDGDREVLGIWWQETEGAKFWLAVLNDLHQRGVADVLIACVDGLTGFPEAIEAVFPKAWVQTCIVHQIRSSMRWVSYNDRKKVAADLRPVYAAANVEDAEHQLAALTPNGASATR